VYPDRVSDPTRPIAIPRPASGADATPTIESIARLRAPALETQGDRYATGTMLGKGGMGEVRLANDRALRRDVALKTLRDANDAEAEVRFVREARITARLDHPNVVPVYDLGRDPQGGLYYTMKRVEGRSLAAAAGEDLSDVRRLQIFVQICDAIAYAHSRGVVHRDLKPANVMVGGYGEVIVLDWGLAKRLGEGEAEPLAARSEHAGPSNAEDGAELTQANTVLGTPSWMAPEQVRGAAYTPAADQYALGAILYFLLAREPAFRSSGDVMAHVVTSNFRRPSVVRPEVPAELEAIVLRAMEASPDDRYPDVAALRDDVQAWLEGREVSAMRYTRWMRLQKAARRQRGPLLAAAAVAGVALVVALAAAAAGTWAYVTSLREEEARTAAAEREARIQVADGQVTLALMHADLDQAITARTDFGAAVESYGRAGAIGTGVPHAERTGGLPLRAWFAQSWLEHRHPTPLLHWDAEGDPVEGYVSRVDESALLFVTNATRVFHVDARDGRTLGRGRLPKDARWLAGGWDSRGDTRVVWSEAKDGRWTVQVATVEASGLGPPTPVGEATDQPPRRAMLRTDALLLETPTGIRAYDAVSGNARSSVAIDAYLDDASADGRTFVGRTRDTGSAFRVAVNHGVWDAITGARLYFQPRGAEVSMDPSGSALLAMSADRIDLVDLPQGVARWTLAEPAEAGWIHGDAVYTLAGGRLTARAPADGRPLATWELPAEAMSAGRLLLPRRRMLVTPGRSPALTPIEAPIGTDLARERPASIRIDVSPDGVLIASAGGLTDGTIRVRDALTGEPVSVFRSNPVLPGVLNRQGPWVTSSSLAGTRDVAFSPDGRRIAAADRDGHVRIWTLNGASVADHEPSPPLGITLNVEWTPTALAAVFEHGDLVVYDSSGSRPLRTLRGTIKTAATSALSPDGRWCVVTGRGVADPQWELWELAKGMVVQRSTRNDVGGSHVTWAPGSTRFAVTGELGSVEVFGLDGARVGRVERPGMALATGFLSDDLLAFSQNSVLHLTEVGASEPFGGMVRPPDEGVADVTAFGDTLYVLRDGGRLARIDLRPVHTSPLRLGGEGVRPEVLVRALARWGRWEEARAWLEVARTLGSAERIPVTERASILRAAGDGAGAHALVDELKASGVLPASLEVWVP
jgi:WD40 repeat protein